MAVKGYIPGVCVGETPYTGADRCQKAEGDLRALIITDKSARYDLENPVFEDSLPTLVYSAGIDRIYPIKDITSFDGSGDDAETSDLGNGYVKPIRNSQYVQTVRIDGGDCLYKELAKFDGQTVRVFRVDADNYVYGTVVANASGTDVFAGFLVTIWVRRVPSSGTDAYGLYLDLYYTINYKNETKALHAIPLNSDIPDGLVSVLYDATTSKVVGSCSGVDYTVQYGPEWVANMFISSTGTAATGASYNAATGTITLTPTGTYRVADASVLAAGGIYGVTGIPLT